MTDHGLPARRPSISQAFNTSPTFGQPPHTRPLNRKYLRAVHAYNPSEATLASLGGDTSKTVSLNPGDIILVHLTHSNGWADGSVLSTGQRGWLPTNYCQNYDHEYIRYLFHALTHFWTACVFPDSSSLGQEPQIDRLAPISNGVRHLLEQSKCLHRQDEVVRNSIEIYRLRKSLLADLADLVQFQEDMDLRKTQQQFAEADEVESLEGLVMRAFRVATRAVQFLDTLTGEQKPTPLPVIKRSTSTTLPSTAARYQPSSSPLKRNSCAVFSSQALKLSIPLPHSTPTKKGPGISPLVEVDDTLLDNLQIEQSQDPVDRNQDSPVSEEDDENADSHLSLAYDAFLENVGSFIGLHVQDKSVSQIADVTTQSLGACARLVAILKVIQRTVESDSNALDNAIQTFDKASAKLGIAASDLSESAEAREEGKSIPQSFVRPLVAAATECVKGAGDAVTEARLALNDQGDFHVDLMDLAPTPTTKKSRSCRQSTTSFSSKSTVRNIRSIYSDRSEPLNLATTEELAPNVDVSSLSSSLSDASLSMMIESAKPALQLSSSPPMTEIAKGPSHFASFLWTTPSRKDSSRTESSKTGQESARNSVISRLSHDSTRATTPDNSWLAGPESPNALSPKALPIGFEPLHLSSRESLFPTRQDSLVQQPRADKDIPQTEAQAQEGFANELLHGKDGQILGGTLRALVETMTSSESSPDMQTMKTFFLTFRSFTTAANLASALVERYNHPSQDSSANAPGRLRVFNMFKQWLENHWDAKADEPALAKIRKFAMDKSIPQIASARQKLMDLVEAAYLRSSLESLSPQLAKEFERPRPRSPVRTNQVQAPPPLISRAQLSLLSIHWKDRCNVLDFEPLEVARQLTLINSTLYRAVLPEELLVSSLTKKDNQSSNVRALSRMSTDLANMVSKSVLDTEDLKRRADMLRHWIKIAYCCSDIQNHDGLMAIMCALSSSALARLRQTWSVVPAKFVQVTDELNEIVKPTRNYATLRQKMADANLPCIPFVGIFLTDLTFVDAGNPNTRKLPEGSGSTGSLAIINFDKHLRTARIIENFQRFQNPFPFAPVPELRSWIQNEFSKVRETQATNAQTFYQQSLVLEPRNDSFNVGPGDKRPAALTLMPGGSVLRKKSPQLSFDKSKLGFSFHKSSADLKKDTFNIQPFPST